MQPSAYKHIIFDMDGTLIPSRSPMKAEHREPFLELCAARDVAVITGQDTEHMEQFLPPQKGNYFVMSRQGNWTVDRDGNTLWQEHVTPEQAAAVEAFGKTLTDEFLRDEGMTLRDPNDIFENRVSQLATSVVGFHAPNEIKYSVDPHQTKRQELLTRHADEVASLLSLGIQVMPAGTTTYDFILAGKHKGYNVTRLIEREGWKKEDCVYVGDALFKGGNDEAVIGVIDTHAIKDPDETFEYVKEILKNPA